MTFDRHGNPIPPTRDQRLRDLVHDLMPLLAAVLLLVAGGMVLRELNMTPSPSVLPATPAAIERPPVELMSIAASLATMAAPSPTPTPRPSPTATYAAVATMQAIHCGPGAAVGSPCEWPLFTPTPQPPQPVCVTPVEGQSCLWRGPVTPTPGVPAWPANTVR
jgi:hypothetical protein